MAPRSSCAGAVFGGGRAAAGGAAVGVDGGCPLRRWPRGGGRRAAGPSADGLDGARAHVHAALGLAREVGVALERARVAAERLVELDPNHSPSAEPRRRRATEGRRVAFNGEPTAVAQRGDERGEAAALGGGGGRAPPLGGDGGGLGGRRRDGGRPQQPRALAGGRLQRRLDARGQPAELRGGGARVVLHHLEEGVARDAARPRAVVVAEPRHRHREQRCALAQRRRRPRPQQQQQLLGGAARPARVVVGDESVTNIGASTEYAGTCSSTAHAARCALRPIEPAAVLQPTRSMSSGSSASASSPPSGPSCAAATRSRRTSARRSARGRPAAARGAVEQRLRQVCEHVVRARRDELAAQRLGGHEPHAPVLLRAPARQLRRNALGVGEEHLRCAARFRRKRLRCGVRRSVEQGVSLLTCVPSLAYVRIVGGAPPARPSGRARRRRAARGSSSR